VQERVTLGIIAVCVAISGYVHFRIWQTDYRHAPVREMFVAQAVVSLVIAVALIAAIAIGTRSSLARAAVWAALVVAAASLIAFALSRGPGLPTLHGTFKETGLETTQSFFFNVGSAKTILVAEGIAVLASLFQLSNSRSPVRR
jgi:hypothetical protein